MHARPILTLSVLLPTLGLLAFAAQARPQEPQKQEPQKNASPPVPPTDTARPAAPPVSFQKEIEPLLKARCITCHNANRSDGGFSIDNLFKGGKQFGSKVIVAYSASESELIATLKGAREPRMPLGAAPFSAEQIAKLALWIDQGAKIETATQSGWPYTRPRPQTVPRVKQTNWPKTPIDNFVLAKLEARGLKPAPPASKHTLLRRVYLDLIGVPPTMNEAIDYLKDSSPDAYEKLVDRLLGDPRYGERWARHWLDVARYADSDGTEEDRVRPRAWRYRDYVVRSLNEDKPYDRFVKEQIAGDELFPGDSDAQIATGFLRLGPGDFRERDNDERRQEFLNDATDSIGTTFLGLTVGCARCHNHKYDRITQADYYSLQSFLAATHWTDARLAAVSDPPEYHEKYLQANDRYQAMKKALNNVRDRHKIDLLAEKIKNAKPGEKQDVSDDEINRSIDKVEKDKKFCDVLEEEIEKLEPVVQTYGPSADTIRDSGSRAPETHILLRGERHSHGPEVKPAFLNALTEGRQAVRFAPPAGGASTGRRAALANWIASADNPLTARVLVNRVWQHHFGKGLVATPSDFGANGDKPSHPELLDWLAATFCERSDEKKLITHNASRITSSACGWSLKKLHKLILLSAAYQQSTQGSVAGKSLDPDNRLLWRMNRVRLEAEVIRDCVLAVSGRLNTASGGPGVYPKISAESLDNKEKERWGESPKADTLRRSLYVFQRRSVGFPFFEAFDGPNSNNTCPTRTTTISVQQALALFNGEFVRTEAECFAQRISRVSQRSWEEQIKTAYWLAFSRPPTDVQLTMAKQFVDRQGRLYLQEYLDSYGSNPDEITQRRMGLSTLTDFCHALLSANEFLYRE